MARRGHIGAGLIVLALWFQALAPVLALRAMAFADPVDHAAICGFVLNAVDLAADPASPAEQAPPAACSLCGLCTAGLATAILPEAPTSVTFPAGLWQAVAWPTPPPAALGRSRHPPGQPRAPPALA